MDRLSNFKFYLNEIRAVTAIVLIYVTAITVGLIASNVISRNVKQ